MVITVGPDLEAALTDLGRKQGLAPEALALQAARALSRLCLGGRASG